MGIREKEERKFSRGDFRSVFNISSKAILDYKDYKGYLLNQANRHLKLCSMDRNHKENKNKVKDEVRKKSSDTRSNYLFEFTPVKFLDYSVNEDRVKYEKITKNLWLQELQQQIEQSKFFISSREESKREKN